MQSYAAFQEFAGLRRFDSRGPRLGLHSNTFHHCSEMVRPSFPAGRSSERTFVKDAANVCNPPFVSESSQPQRKLSARNERREVSA